MNLKEFSFLFLECIKTCQEAYLIIAVFSEKAGFITGENICIDGGMTKLMIYHGGHGWEYKAQ